MAKRYLKEHSSASITDEQMRKLQDERKHSLSSPAKCDSEHEIIAAAHERKQKLSRVEHHMEKVVSQAKLLDDQAAEVCGGGKKKKKKKGWLKRKKKSQDIGGGGSGDATHVRGDQAARQAALRSAETSGLMASPPPMGDQYQYDDLRSVPTSPTASHSTASHYTDISSAPSAASVAASRCSPASYLDVKPSKKGGSPHAASNATRPLATGATAASEHDMYNDGPPPPMPACRDEAAQQRGRETPFSKYGDTEQTGLLSAAEIGLEDEDKKCCTIA